MTIETTDWAMISDRTPEHAFRIDGFGAAVWRLSWLPEHRLTQVQALAGMELDELLSDPDAVHDESVHRRVADRAGALGVRYEEAVILLSRRMIERMRRHSGGRTRREAEPVLSGPTHRPRPVGFTEEPPRVFG
ncbi:hypothetical protein [Nocardia mexicana]|uniref:Uncharacterized protein n=1 Tax=Nocardia mexicana TaxID=279262 RepID=A0A370HDU3_9NOCA|nr:hypothetical protein [Nocardia mexicana]RDI55403.1 hypothetical protein DFR68_101236 [Nocardia mexicana]